MAVGAAAADLFVEDGVGVGGADVRVEDGAGSAASEDTDLVENGESELTVAVDNLVADGLEGSGDEGAGGVDASAAQCEAAPVKLGDEAGVGALPPVKSG